MKGKKIYNPKMMCQVHLNNLVPQEKFYKKLDNALDLNFLYKESAQYYGIEEQESIDPVVFIKICLVGYLNNISSDRRLIEHGMERASSDISLMFVAYNLRRLINIPGFDLIKRYLMLLISFILTFFKAITSILRHFLLQGYLLESFDINFYYSAKCLIFDKNMKIYGY
jgi:hypothetical protein